MIEYLTNTIGETIQTDSALKGLKLSGVCEILQKGDLVFPGKQLQYGEFEQVGLDDGAPGHLFFLITDATTTGQDDGYGFTNNTEVNYTVEMYCISANPDILFSTINTNANNAEIIRQNTPLQIAANADGTIHSAYCGINRINTDKRDILSKLYQGIEVDSYLPQIWACMFELEIIAKSCTTVIC